MQDTYVIEIEVTYKLIRKNIKKKERELHFGFFDLGLAAAEEEPSAPPEVDPPFISILYPPIFLFFFFIFCIFSFLYYAFPFFSFPLLFFKNFLLSKN